MGCTGVCENRIFISENECGKSVFFLITTLRCNNPVNNATRSESAAELARPTAQRLAVSLPPAKAMMHCGFVSSRHRRLSSTLISPTEMIFILRFAAVVVAGRNPPGSQVLTRPQPVAPTAGNTTTIAKNSMNVSDRPPVVDRVGHRLLHRHRRRPHS